jgi:hypothetical protein
MYRKSRIPHKTQIGKDLFESIPVPDNLSGADILQGDYSTGMAVTSVDNV